MTVFFSSARIIYKYAEVVNYSNEILGFKIWDNCWEI